MDWSIRKYFKYKIIENIDFIIDNKIKNKYRPKFYHALKSHDNVKYGNYLGSRFNQILSQFYYVTKNTYLVGPDAVGITNDNEIIVDTAGGSIKILDKCNPKMLMYHKHLPIEATIDYASVYITPYINVNNNNYSHWVIECLLLIESVFAFEKKTGHKPKIIINSKPQNFQIESLKLLGFFDKDIILWNYNKILVKNLIVPACRLGVGKEKYKVKKYIINPDSMHWLRKKLTENIITSNNGHRNIMISRQGSKGRRFINHLEIMKVLKQYNFKEYKLELLSEYEKIKLFSNAKNIIGANGAGLINLIYCKNANVISIVGKNSKIGENRTLNSIFQDIAVALELNYYELLSDLSYNNYSEENTKSALLEYDLNVNLNELKKIMIRANMI